MSTFERPSSEQNIASSLDVYTDLCVNTDEYTMSFEERRPKILEICRTLFWPDTNHELTRIEPAQENKWNLAYPVAITHDGGESFDNYVVQLPYFVDTLTEEMEILRVLRRMDPIQKLLPQVFHEDATRDNPLNHPYIVRSRIPGQPLEDVYDKMTQEQKVAVAAELGRVYQTVQGVRYAFSGNFELCEDCMDGNNHHTDDDDYDNVGEAQGCTIAVHGPVRVMPFGTMEDEYEEEIDWDVATESIAVPIDEEKDDGAEKKDDKKEYQVLTRDNLRDDEPNLTAREILLLTLERRIHRNLHWASRAWESADYLEPALKVVREIVENDGHKDKDHAAAFAAGGDATSPANSLTNQNLDVAGNIMVDFDADNKPVITGILDWGSTGFEPLVLSCRPPAWLWTREGEEYEEKEPLDVIDDAALDPARAQIKRAFDEAAGAAFRAAAYGADRVFARRYFAVAQRQNWSCADMDELEYLREAWNQRKQQQQQQQQQQ